MKTEQQLPKNIRQIGSPVGHTKVYIEDYVITFLNSIAIDKNTFVRGAILFGEKKSIGSDTVIFVRGAIEGQNLELDLDETVFDDNVWREIYQQKDRFFPELEVMGWALSRMGFSVRLNDKIKKTHFENFPGEGKILYMMDYLEQEDAFYVFRGQDLVRQNGYYIYYEKNPMMQEYLIERNQRIKEAQSYENMLEAKRDEKVIRQFREKISQKTKSSQRKGLIRKMSSAAAMALIIFMGGTMYYYVQNDTTVNFKDIVRGAVNTMGKGVKEQVDSTDKEMPSTLDTESEEKETSDSSTIQRATTTTEYNSETTTTESPKNSTENTVTQSAGAYQRYIVRKGDTLVSISKRIYGTQTMVKKIKEANGLSNENQIYPGQKLLVPKSIN
ncbi:MULTISPECIES: LysM peptidoglycan-binding domain-containing protein [Anaerostipes]|uniref:LysM peptidoglycan-binding domain-containing protein n=1 Tax=Anaerostipes TaxID=207244 RepID=UPI001C1DF6BC|nr:LysM peptidoglycan-binding domain-containing protein [Anaerostipes sp.]MCI5622921.1 LysM peptidoglycan-binding domain-containing protein [Anaerostipes sp.]MDY2725882.1 LysM peptidoglycan-binding domain-containing protein [Anaerostipes faecalis]